MSAGDTHRGDLTPLVGAETDVAPLGRSAPKPAHELTADEDRDPVDWHAIEATAQFRTLLAARARFVVPAGVFFIVYYFALPVLVGYAPGLMSVRVWGPLNLAYLFALSQFAMAWIVAALYLRAASRWDRMAAGIAAGAPRAGN